MAELPEFKIQATINRVLNCWPTAGLAVAVVKDGSPRFFSGRGVADVASETPVTEDTVFRIGSITKTMTAIAVMQLYEQGLLDLDAPASDYLRSYALVPSKANFHQPTLRHLLTHTAGVRAVRGPSDMLRPELGWGVRAGRQAPSLAEYYRGGLHFDFEPGTRWAYTNHGFATLGQIVEDVSGLPLALYLQERVFKPLGMESSSLIESERLRTRLATGYAIRSRGLVPVPEHQIAPAGGGSVYSTARDMARYAAALLAGGSNDQGSVLKPETLATMFQPQYQPDPRIPGMGLAFFRNEVSGHRTVGHDGIWKGFLADMTLALDDGVGILAFANTGGFNHRGAPVAVTSALSRLLLGAPEDTLRADVPEHPAIWSELCGWYSFGRGGLADPQSRLALGAGVEVVVRHGELMIRGQTPIPAVRRGLRLHPDDDGDPYVFRIDFSAFGLGSSRVVFSRAAEGGVTALCLGVAPMSLQKLPVVRNPRLWINRALLVGVATSILIARRRRRHRMMTGSVRRDEDSRTGGSDKLQDASRRTVEAR